MSLSDKLNAIAKQRTVKARVGIIESKTYPDGTSVAFVGYINEYGYKGMVPERRAMVYHSVDMRTGEMRNEGRFVKKSKANLAREVIIPAHEINIPPRPFFRTAVANNRDTLGQKFMARLAKGDDAETAMRMICEHMVDELKTSVITWKEPPNAPSTVQQKGFNAPLRGVDRLLRNSFSYEIDND